MSDQGFDFQQPPPRREARRFEPPPWEKELFEQRAREQAERERLERESAEKQAALEAERTAGDTPAAVGEVEALQAGEAPRPSGPKRELGEKQLELMMIGLRAEEPDSFTWVWLVSTAAGVVVGLVGLAIGVWGATVVARRALGQTSAFAGMVMIAFGLTLVGIGGWLAYKSLRQQGVL